ncbi:MAG: hypothetical protein IT429_16510 [Gemmataceae bacterium]|nr:hypothetical protein [Gemmataceae bacterium]
MSRLRILPGLVAAVLLVGPGCGKQERPLGEARPVPKKVDEGGWPLYEQPEDGFALALPPGWTALRLDPRTLDQVLKQGLDINPDLKAMEQTIRQQAAAGVKFIGLEKAGGGPNVNVLRTALIGKVPVGAAADNFIKQYETIPNVERPIARRQVKLRSGEAEKLDIVMPVNMPTGEKKRLAMTSYLVVRGQTLYVVTCTAAVDEAGKYRQTFDRITQSFRIFEE